MLRIEHPPGYAAERAYIFDFVFRELLGLEFASFASDRTDVRVSLADAPNGAGLIVAESLFGVPEDCRLTSSANPMEPLARWRIPQSLHSALMPNEPMPVLYGSGDEFTVERENGQEQVRIGLDVFGGAFWLLSRYEEITCPERDDRDRFTAAASLSTREEFLERPLVNEYAELLWMGLSRLWPRLERRARAFDVRLSHDVDVPYCTAGVPLKAHLLSTAADLLTRRNPALARIRQQSAWRTSRGAKRRDMCFNFDEIMDISERHGLRSAFYFFGGGSDPKLDAAYTLEDPEIQSALTKIHERGHEIGLHPSYQTYLAPERLCSEWHSLKRTCDALKIEQEVWGGRQHYLRWRNPDTWRNYESAGLDYDSTVGFADRIGFRAGVCCEYPVFDLRRRVRMKLRERPLFVMDQTLLRYMSLGREEMESRVANLARACRKFGGTFTFLWHNNNLVSMRDRALYETLLTRIVS